MSLFIKVLETTKRIGFSNLEKLHISVWQVFISLNTLYNRGAASLVNNWNNTFMVRIYLRLQILYHIVIEILMQGLKTTGQLLWSSIKDKILFYWKMDIIDIK